MIFKFFYLMPRYLVKKVKKEPLLASFSLRSQHPLSIIVLSHPLSPIGGDRGGGQAKL
jgi:hypothetical protein